MARRDRRRNPEQNVVDTPDIVEAELWSLSDWMEKHWKPVVIGLVGVSVVWGGLGVYQIIAASSEQSRAESTAAVFETAAAPVVAPSDSPDAPPPTRTDKTYPTEAARAEAVLAAGKEGDGKSAAAIGVLLGGAKASKGDREGQLQALNPAIESAKGTALELPLREQKASALQALGKTAEAAAEWDAVGKLAVTDFTKALAKARIGDLYNAATGSKASDPAKAKAAYEEALKLARPGDKDPPAGSLAFLAADVRGKLATL